MLAGAFPTAANDGFKNAADSARPWAPSAVASNTASACGARSNSSAATNTEPRRTGANLMVSKVYDTTGQRGALADPRAAGPGVGLPWHLHVERQFPHLAPARLTRSGH